MNIAIVGTGAMGRVLKGIIEEKENMNCVAFIEPTAGEKLEDSPEKPQIIIDFSNPANLKMIADFARTENCGVVIATTGFDNQQLQEIVELSQKVPVVQTANFSLGITVMKRMLAEIAPILKNDFDMEIIEKHHKKKLDAPSGTAKLLASAMVEKGEFQWVYGRQGNSKRGKELGIHAIRGGTIAGEHTVIFAGEDEILEVKHRADSKKIFALGAVRAAEFVYEKMQEAGLYNMEDVLFS